MTDREELRTQLNDAVDADKATAYDDGRKRSDNRSAWLIALIAVVAVIAIAAALLASMAAVDTAANSRSLNDNRKVNQALAAQQSQDAKKLQDQIDKLNAQRVTEGKPPVTSADVPSSGLSPDTKKLVQLVLAALPVPALPAPAPGPAGPSGQPAQPGEDGTNGTNGSNGSNGASITDVTLTDCVLTITVTDPDGTATDYPLGNICGPQGDPGEAGPPGESVQGPPGAPGPAGTQGVGVAGTTYSCTGTDLIITTTYTTGAQESSTIAGSPACPTAPPTQAPPT